jgi:hypothetical protein
MMMSDPKPLASLSSGLLARKGQAAPAMRRQGMMGMINTAQPTAPSHEFDDLGWNDMGEESEYLPGKAGLSPMGPSPVTALPVSMPAPVAPITEDVTPEQPETPAVVLQQQELAREMVASQPTPAVMAAPEPMAAAPIIAAPQPVVVSPAPHVPTRAAPGSRGKAAFTLRLDADRHLKLRLVCAVSHRSAQQVVTDALDTFLATQALPAGLTSGSAR